MQKVELDSLFKFTKKQRLVSKEDFQLVFANAQKITNKYLLALFHPTDAPHARLGLIIAKNRIKLSVDRNRVRRVLRESFRQHQTVLKGLDIIVLLRSECTPRNTKVLRDDVDKLWHRLVKLSKPA